MKMTHNMMKTSIQGIFAIALCAVGLPGACGNASADVVGWWRFNGEGSAVPNVANPGTLDGTIQSIVCNADQSYDTTFGSDSANMPNVTSNFAGAAPRIIDPVSGEVFASGGTLSWQASNVAGGMVVPYGEALDDVMTQFTIEAMVRLPTNAVSRGSSGGGSMLPIAQFGRDQKAGWIFAIWEGRPWCRLTYLNSDGTTYHQSALNTTLANSYAANLPSLFDGKWHHVAMSLNTSGESICARLFLDGTQFGEVRNTGTQKWSEWGFSDDRPACPLVVGREPYRTNRTFWGDIAEVRLSDELLSVNQFLVPLADGHGLADDDTALLLDFDSALAFGSDALSVVPCQATVGSATTNCTWFARNWNLLNAAYRQPLVPRWWPFSKVGFDGGSDTDVGWVKVTNNVTFAANVATPAMDAADVWNDLLLASSADGSATNACLESASLSIATASGGTTESDRLHAISLTPDASLLPTNSYTIEFTFKTTGTSINTVLYCPFLKVCNNKGKMLFRGYTTKFGGSSSGTELTSGTINDGAWHHAAYVYNKTAGKCTLYMDYGKIGEKTYAPYAGGGAGFMVGGQFWTDGNSGHANYQGFNGSLGTFRITRRALGADEFLRAEALPAPLFLATFDGDTPPSFSTGLPDYLAPAGTGATMSGGASAPALAGSRAGSWILDGEGGTDKASCGAALSLDGGYVLWPRNRLLERRSFTLEFFGNFKDLPNAATFARLNIGSDVGSPVWALYNNISTSDGKRRLYAVVSVTTDGGVTFSRGSDLALYNLTDHASECAGWHHWAMTVEQQETRVEVKLYKDGVNVTAGTQVRKTGQLYLPPEGTCLSFGASTTSSGRMAGLFDNIRISDGVLAPSAFMQYEPAPFVLFMR